MRQQSILTRERTVYWPSAYAEIVDLLTGRDTNGRQIAGAPFNLNVGVIVMAAALGLREGRKRDVPSDSRKEISTSTFLSNGLEMYLLLIPILANPESATDNLRPEQEEEMIREFERYAAGGLEILEGEFERAGASSLEVVMQGLLVQPDKPSANSKNRPELF
jgi:dnd system-associated protein 4